MNQCGKILVKNLKVLVTGSNSRLGTQLTNTLLSKGSHVFTADKRITNLELCNKQRNSFKQIDLADESLLQDYLKQIDSIDAVVNCAGYRSSYNYFLSYIISKNIMEKFKENKINEFGCKGSIVNLVNLNGNYNDEYFKKQDEFIAKYNIDQSTIDGDVYKLADLLTAERIRCNTVMVEDKSDLKIFSSLIIHILEDQYIAGQVINMEDNLKHSKITFDDVHAEVHKFPSTIRKNEPYVPPKEKAIDSLPSNSLPKLI